MAGKSGQASSLSQDPWDLCPPIPVFNGGNPFSLWAPHLLDLRLFWYLWILPVWASTGLKCWAILWAEVKMSWCCDRRGSSRPSFACGSQRSNNNEGDLTQNVSPEVLRHLYMILLSQSSLELLLVPPTLIHSHRAWLRKELVHVSSDNNLKINKNEWKIAEEVIL